MKINKLKITYILLCVLPCLCIKTSAQVTVGADKKPGDYSVLEINTDNTPGGLRMPHLTTAQRNGLVLSGKPAEGLTIYNTTIDCIEYWDGANWMNNCGTVDRPYVGKLNIYPRYNTYSDNTYLFTGAVFAEGTEDNRQRGTEVAYANMDAGYFRYVDAEGQVLPYSEFTHDSGLKVIIEAQALGGSEGSPVDGLIAIKVSGTPSSAYAGKAFDIPLTLFGYKLKVRVNTGCGAYTSVDKFLTDNNGIVINWKQWQCFNLGADPGLDPFEWYSLGDDVNFDIKGGLYQWGRRTDGHENRKSLTTNVTSSGNIPGHSLFIIPDSDEDWQNPSNSKRWGGGDVETLNPPKGVNDPCPDGWKVPSYLQFVSVFDREGGCCDPDWATHNFIKGTKEGFYIGDAFYMPSAGRRMTSGASVISNVGTNGYYWFSNKEGSLYPWCVKGLGLHNLDFFQNEEAIAGYSVRCIADD